MVSLSKLCQWLDLPRRTVYFRPKPRRRVINAWQVRKRSQGFRPRARSLPSAASRPDERWATDLTHVWCGKARRASLAEIIDCCTREIRGWRLSDNGRNKTAEAALEEALVHRFESLGQARALISRWIRYYNEERPHQS